MALERARMSAVSVRQSCVVTESRGEGLGLNPLTDGVAFGRLLNHGTLISFFNEKTKSKRDDYSSSSCKYLAP